MIRFFIAPFAVVPLIALSVWGRRRVGLVTLGVLFLFQSAMVSNSSLYGRQARRFMPPLYVGGFIEVERFLPDDCTLLLLAMQNCRDYALFSPETRFSRQVVLWGDRQADETIFNALVEREKIDAILFESDKPLYRLNDTFYDPQPLITLICSSGKWEEMALKGSSSKRLFLLKD